MMKELTMAVLVAGATGLAKADAWDKTFPKSDKVEHCKATFKNRFGITLMADVYKPIGRAACPQAADGALGQRARRRRWR